MILDQFVWFSINRGHPENSWSMIYALLLKTTISIFAGFFQRSKLSMAKIVWVLFPWLPSGEITTLRSTQYGQRSFLKASFPSWCKKYFTNSSNVRNTYFVSYKFLQRSLPWDLPWQFCSNFNFSFFWFRIDRIIFKLWNDIVCLLKPLTKKAGIITSWVRRAHMLSNSVSLTYMLKKLKKKFSVGVTTPLYFVFLSLPPFQKRNLYFSLIA